MTVENAKYLNQLNPSYPSDGDLILEGDDHIRLIKEVLSNTFTNIDKQVLASSDLLNELMDYKSYIDNKLEELYPVGSIYTSVVSTSPGGLLGFGTWETIGEGRVLVGAGSGTDSHGVNKQFLGGSTGGEYEHTLTNKELPDHTHGVTISSTNLGNKSTSLSGDHTHYYVMDDYTGTERGLVPGGQGTEKIRELTSEYGSDGNGNLWLYRTSHAGAHTHGIDLGSHSHSVTVGDSGGAGQPHNNIQPYLTVFMWTRTA